MKPPCELVVSKVLPSVRSAIVKILIEEHKMKQTDVAKILGISQGSTSLYITSMRARDKKFLQLFPEIKKYTKELAERIASGKLKSTPLTLCAVCKQLRKSTNFCNLHKEFAQLAKCRICYTGSEI